MQIFYVHNLDGDSCTMDETESRHCARVLRMSKGDRVNLIGYASSNARVSTLMRNLEASPWLESPSLVEIKAAIVDKLPTNEFIVNVSLTREKVETPDAGKASKKPEKG